MILMDNYMSYENALKVLDLETLSDRRENLCLSFARKCLKNERMSQYFEKNEKEHQMKTRNEEKFKVSMAHTEKMKKIANYLHAKAIEQILIVF